MNPFHSEVFQFIISDAGPEGKFVLDLKNGSGAAKAGEESGAVGIPDKNKVKPKHDVILSEAGLA